MKKLFVVFITVLVFAMTGMTSMAAEIPDQYENYEIVKKGIMEDLVEAEEGEDLSYISVEFKEVPSEKVCVYNVKATDLDGEEYVMYLYLNGETDEFMGVMYDSEGEVVDSEISTLTEEAEWYRE